MEYNKRMEMARRAMEEGAANRLSGAQQESKASCLGTVRLGRETVNENLIVGLNPQSTLWDDDDFNVYKTQSGEEISISTAMNQALRFLAPRFLSCYELRQKMRRKGIPEALINQVEEKLIYYDYLNDTRLAEQVTELFMREKKYGLYMIKQKMKLRGLIPTEALNSYDEMGAAYHLVEKKYSAYIDLYQREGRKAVSLQKIMNFLKYRGFSASVIRTVVNDVFS